MRPAAGLRLPPAPDLPADPPLPWELIAAEEALSARAFDLSSASGSHRLVLRRLEVGRHGARLAYSLRPPWVPDAARHGRAALPRPSGRAVDSMGRTYRVDVGPSDGDTAELEGWLLVHPAPRPPADWLDLELDLGAAGGSAPPSWRFRLDLS